MLRLNNKIGGYTNPNNSRNTNRNNSRNNNSNNNTNNSNRNSATNNVYNYWPEPSEENIMNSAEFEENARRYRQPIFASLDNISRLYEDFLTYKSVNQLYDIIDEMENFKSHMSDTDSYSLRETYRILESTFEQILQELEKDEHDDMRHMMNKLAEPFNKITDEKRRLTGAIGGKRRRVKRVTRKKRSTHKLKSKRKSKNRATHKRKSHNRK
jgi:hypothetical protein